jgi:LysR family transcriptional regulator (chromosome initiation inhibitor)
LNIDYDALAVLSAVVRTGSFEAAAKSLNVTQSAVSQRIKQLEDKVGSVLIIRGRPCLATEDGLILCQHIEQVTLLRHEVNQQLSGGGGKSTGNVRIAVNSDSLATWFPEVVERAAADLNLRLDIVPDDQEFTEDRLRSGDALAIVTSSDNHIPGCKIFPLGSMDYLAVASPDFIAKHLPAGANLAAMAAAPAIRFDRKDTLPLQWLEAAFGDASRLSSHNIPSYESHLICSQRGIGWAMMPFESVEPLIAAGDLVEIVPDVRVKIPLFWHSRAQSSGILQRLSDVVLEVAGRRLN